MNPPAVLLLNSADNVVVCCRDVQEGETVVVGGRRIVSQSAVPLGHKIAIAAIGVGTRIVKVGMTIGIATSAIAEGGWVHLHNTRSQYIASTVRDGG